VIINFESVKIKLLKLDRKLLQKSKVEEAQQEKEVLENFQRTDVKKRKEYKKHQKSS
jgi:hypothetical protein